MEDMDLNKKNKCRPHPRKTNRSELTTKYRPHRNTRQNICKHYSYSQRNNRKHNRHTRFIYSSVISVKHKQNTYADIASTLYTQILYADVLSRVIGVVGIWWSIPIGWFIADAVGICFYLFKFDR